jgi:hypothetical protein
MSVRSAVRVGLAALLMGALAGLSGCGGSVGQVAGRVSSQGQAVPKAELVFTLEGQPAEVFYGVTREDGSYRVDVGAKKGLPPGTYQVAVTDFVLADGTLAPGGEEGAALQSAGRAFQRTHMLTKEVAAGQNEIEIKLEEGQLQPQEAEF